MVFLRYTFSMTVPRQNSPYTNLCQFLFADGRQCCMPGLPSLNGFCHSHAALNRRKAPVEEDLSGELAQFFCGPDSSLDVHRALERVFRALAGNRISTRRAATFGYLGQLILLSKPGEESQSLSKSDLHDLCDVTCSLLRTAYPPTRQSSGPATTPVPSPNSPAATPSPSNSQPRRSQ